MHRIHYFQGYCSPFIITLSRVSFWIGGWIFLQSSRRRSCLSSCSQGLSFWSSEDGLSCLASRGMSFEDLPFTTSTTARGSRSSSIFWSPTVLPWSAHWPRLNTPDEGSSDCRKTQTDAYIFQDGGVQPSRWCRPCCVRQDWWLHSPVHILTCNYWYSFRFPQLPFCPWLGYLLRCCLSLTWR